MTTLRNVKAKDIMRPKVVAFTPSTSIRSAIKTFEELHIGAAPVIDEYGNMLGMLSASDIAKTEHMQGDAIRVQREDLDRARALDVDEFLEFEEAEDAGSPSPGDCSVVEWMTGDAFSVAPESPLQTICSLMVREHVHRVPVIDNGKVVGIISTMDIVRCVAEAMRLPGIPQADTSKPAPEKRLPRAAAKAAHSSPADGKRASASRASLKR